MEYSEIIFAATINYQVYYIGYRFLFCDIFYLINRTGILKYNHEYIYDWKFHAGNTTCIDKFSNNT